MKAIAHTLDDNRTCLVITDADKLKTAVGKVVTYLAKKGAKGVFVSINMPHNSIEDILKKADVNTNDMYFIDCITALSHKIPHKKMKNVEFGCNPSDLTSEGRITQSISQFVASTPGEKFIVIDTLRTMLLYNEPDLVASFVENLIKLSRDYNTKVIVLTRKDDDSQLIDDISYKFDAVVTL